MAGFCRGKERGRGREVSRNVIKKIN